MDLDVARIPQAEVDYKLAVQDNWILMVQWDNNIQSGDDLKIGNVSVFIV